LKQQVRLVLSDRQWARIEKLCVGKPGDPGGTGANNRMFVETAFTDASLEFPRSVAHSVPLSTFKQLVEIGDGRVRGAHLLQLWKNPPLESTAIHDLLQIPDDIATPRSSRLIALFREWYARPMDLPGTYYLQVVQRLYKENQLATGRFVGLGRAIDLSMVNAPIFLVGARDDEIVAPEQLFAARRLVCSKRRQIRQAVVACSHLGLFMGATTLLSVWPKVARWLAAS
jgi:PHB depolymerase-like protein